VIGVIQSPASTLAGKTGPAEERGTGPSVEVPIVVADRIWGVFVAWSPLGMKQPQAEHRLARFAEAITPTILSAQARTQLAKEQAAQRRVAELAARDAPAEQVLGAVAFEALVASGVEFTILVRFDRDGFAEIVALHGAPADFAVGMRAWGDEDVAVQRVLRTGQVVRIEDLASMSARWPQIASRSGSTVSVAVPISIQGAPWGALEAVGRLDLLSASAEELLTRFAELAGIAMSAAQTRLELRLLADEQAALSRVAALVVRGADLNEVFTAVTAEASGLVADVAAVLVRFGSDGTFVLVAATNSNIPVGFRGRTQDGALLRDLIRTGAPARVDNVEETPWAGAAREMDAGATTAVPVRVESRLWGALTVSSVHWPLPENIEKRLLKFAELAGAAIANAENKAKLTASRARVVATADETRRRLQRDVHKSAQQRLMHTILTLKLARQSMAPDSPPAALVDEALLNAERASNELRDIVRGILPAALTRGGLRLGLESLLSNVALPVDLQVTAPRCSTETEQTAYFIVAEALTNVTKHAHAGRATVSVTFDGDWLTVEVHDNGIGGANPGVGTGLIGVADRVDAAEGALTLTSPIGGGTTLLVRLPARALPHPDR
jgi:signal transduction histidine kinase